MRAATSTVVVVAAVAMMALGGCRATTYAAEPVSYVEVTSAPIDVEVYPRTYYDGRVVYYANNRWMYREGGRWVYYQQEPPALYRQRTYVRQAPPASPYRPPDPRYDPGQYPWQYPGYQVPAQPIPGSAPPTSAPPAVRVR